MARRVGRGDGTLKTAPWLRWIWLGPAAFLLLFLAVPLAALASRVWDPESVARLLDGPTWRIAALASVQAGLSTVLALAIGLPIAAVVSRYRFRGRALAQALVTVPFVLPTVVVALAFRSLFGPSAPQGLAVVIVAHAYINLAVVVRIVGARWSQHDDRYETVARTLGATRLRAFVTVTIPMLRASIASSAGVVFIFSFTSLGIVLILGDSTTRTLESQVLRQTSVLLDFPGAVATALIQLLLVCTVLAIGAIVTRRAPTERTLPPTLRPLPRSAIGRVSVLAVAGTACALVLAPVLALVLASFTSNGALTFDWWRSLGSIDAGTTRIGSPLSALATSLAFAAIAGRITALAAIVPLGVSAATLGLGTLLAFGRPPFDLRATGLLVPLAHSLVAVPLVVAVVAPALRAADPRTQIVAASLGAHPTRAFATAYGPILRVVMLAAGGLAAAVSLGEFGAASFLARAGDPTVPIQIVRLLGRPGPQSYGVAASLAVVLVILTLTLVLLIDRAGRGWRQSSGRTSEDGVA